MRRGFPSWSLQRWSAVLGIATFVVLSLPVLTVLALISVVGIPLALAMMATPTIFLVVVVAAALQKGIGVDRAHSGPASLLASLVLIAGVAQLYNARLDLRADGFLADDHDELARPLRARTLGLVTLNAYGGSKGTARCDELCQRLLLAGTVERVITANLPRETVEWTAVTPALSYRFESRETCPPVNLPEGQGRGGLDDQSAPGDTMRLAIASGRCLVEEAATLGDAEAVVTTGRLQRGANELRAGLSPGFIAVTADRATVHVREGAGFVEKYRWTGVSVGKHPYLLVPTLIGAGVMQFEPGFARRIEKHNERAFHRDEVQAGLFVRDELGLDVAFAGKGTTPTATDLVAKALDRPGSLDRATTQVIEDLFASLRTAYAFASTPRQLDEPTRRLALRALDDPRVVAPRDTWALVRACEKAGDAVHAELADVLFRKLVVTDPALREDHPSYLGWPSSYLANAIAMLPPGAVRAHRDDLEKLARDPAMRVRAHAALSQLATFGADAVPTLMMLVDEGCAMRTHSQQASRSAGNQDWQEVYLAGLKGLCVVGGEGAAALEPMWTRLRDGTLPTYGSYRDLTLKTLVRLGAEPESLRPLLGDDGSAGSGSRFDRVVQRARKDGDCVY